MAALIYTIVEDSLKVCNGIKERMDDFSEWECCCFLHHQMEAIKEIKAHQPSLIFIDWALKGGSAYDVLINISGIPAYSPYIIFNTGYQSENPEIPQEIINNFKIDKYLVKPVWENLRLHLGEYLNEAKQKGMHPRELISKVWMTDINRKRHNVDLANLSFIQQQFSNPYNKIFYFTDSVSIVVKINWVQITDRLEKQGIRFFISNCRQHIIVNDFIESYKRPFVKLHYFKQKIEIVKNRLSAFEKWLDENE